MLLDGPKKAAQLENLKTMIRAVGARRAFSIIGYNFSIAGVAGRIKGRFARGEAEAVGMDGPYNKPMPRGMAWNMVYNANAPAGAEPSATSDQLCSGCKIFSTPFCPWPEEAGVVLAAHPDDPPLPTIRAQPRLVYQPQLYQRLIDLHPSRSNALEFCVGTLAEMTEGDVYEAVDAYSRQDKIAYVHLRNVHGKVPTYKETFIDGRRRRRAARAENFETEPIRTGVIIPDHRAANELRRPLACRNGLCPGLPSGSPPIRLAARLGGRVPVAGVCDPGILLSKLALTGGWPRIRVSASGSRSDKRHGKNP